MKKIDAMAMSEDMVMIRKTRMLFDAYIMDGLVIIIMHCLIELIKLCILSLFCHTFLLLALFKKRT